jgi:hypothetical protein
MSKRIFLFLFILCITQIQAQVSTRAVSPSYIEELFFLGSVAEIPVQQVAGLSAQEVADLEYEDIEDGLLVGHGGSPN